jgi:hypothetical protein
VPPTQFDEYWRSGAAKPRGIGIMAFVLALVVCVGVPIAMGAFTVSFWPLVQGARVGTTFLPSLLSADQVQQVGGMAFAIAVVLAVGTLLGLWALVQGIVAIASRRGRGWGVAALILAVAAPMITFVVYFVVIAVEASVSPAG